MYCPSCGTANAVDNKFCASCGSALAGITDQPPTALAIASPSPAAVLSPTGKNCPVCQRRYEIAVQFCEADGTRLSPLAAAPTVPIPPPPELEPTTPPPVPFPAAAAEAAEPTEPAPGALMCPACRTPYPAGTRFCELDGTPLGPVAAAHESDAVFDRPWEFEDEDDEPAPPRSRWLAFAAFTIGVLLIAAASFSAYRQGLFDRWIGAQSSDVKPAAQPGAKPANVSAVPGLTGTYSAHLSDQDVTLTVTGTGPRTLVSADSEISYRNTVTGNECTAALRPTESGGIGGDTSNAVSFKQISVPGKRACPADIPVKMDITGQPLDPSRIVTAVAVEWHSSDGKRVLMSGTLIRAAPR